ncbi:hypothetical protein WNY78_06345 [Psychroserpens sp. AS72]|uniref:hypothetical protein n=1 Tax=Psychroserpens sp. AS72 TaxID=3135775 RepID=UPI00317EEDA0
MRKYLIVVIILIITGCSDGFNYETNAIYSAEASNLTVNLKASGFILHGHDLDDDGIVNGYITSTKFTDTLFIKATEYKLFVQSNKTDTITSRANKGIKQYLDEIHYKNYNTQELSELEDVIKATAYGPKGTYMKGQTKLINVLRVDFNTY